MTTSNRYRLSFHISHPSISATEIVASSPFPVHYSRSVGEKRVTKTGRDLEGVYSRTDVSFDVSGGVVLEATLPLCERVRTSLDNLPRGMIKEVSSSGGECFYLVGIYSEDNFLVHFPGELLSLLSLGSIGLKLDFYGGADVDKNVSN